MNFPIISCCVAAYYFVSYHGLGEAGDFGYVRGHQHGSRDHRRHRAQKANRAIENAFLLVTRKKQNGMMGAGRAVASWVDRTSGDRQRRAAAADDHGQPRVKL